MIADSQQMFMLLFSILYGIMLNSLLGLGAFPIGTAFAGKDVERIKGALRSVKGTRSRDRLCLSFVLFNFLPFIYFGVGFQLIGDFVGEFPSPDSFHAIAQILFIGLLSLGVFAFYRFFLGLVIWQPKGYSFFYTPYELEEQGKKRAIYPSPRIHILSGFIYLAPWLTVVLARIIGLLLNLLCCSG